MADKDWNAPDCDDQLPLVSGIGHNSTTEVIIHSSVGQRSVDELSIHSTIGRGPTGPAGPTGPQGLPGTSSPIVLVPRDQWPPADPIDGVLYLLDGVDYSLEASILNYGGDPTNTIDSLAAFNNAISDNGLVMLPPGDFFVSEPVDLPPNEGVGIIGAGAGLTRIHGPNGIVRCSGYRERQHLEGFSLIATGMGAFGNQTYADAIAMDLAGFSYGVIRDIRSRQFRRNLSLDTPTAANRCFFNTVDNFTSWGGVEGLFLGGCHTPVREGSNANKFSGVTLRAAQIGARLRGGMNMFDNIRIENPLRDPGYPLQAVGIQVDSGYYALGNSFSDPYIELTGDETVGNSAIYFHEDAPGLWATPFYASGGLSGVVGPDVVKFDPAVAAAKRGCHINVPGISPSQNMMYDSDGRFLRMGYEPGAGLTITDDQGSVLYGNVRHTAEGGVALRMMNRTGAPSVKNSLVSPGVGDDAFVLTSNTYDAIGVCYEEGVADGEMCWVVTNGRAAVLVEDAYVGDAAVGQLAIASTQPGRITLIANPGSGLPAVDTHFKEVGHCSQFRVAAAGQTVRCLLHFN